MSKLKKLGKAIALGAAMYGANKFLAPKTAVKSVAKKAVTTNNPNIMKIKNFDELFGSKKFVDKFGTVRNTVANKRFTFMKDGGEITIGKNVDKDLL
jgi:hypothetical protein|tara:strand:+ start:173 stop:463 length:291 start_codon:yes stop_codon:yes gene_type:complete